MKLWVDYNGKGTDKQYRIRHADSTEAVGMFTEVTINTVSRCYSPLKDQGVLEVDGELAIIGDKAIIDFSGHPEESKEATTA